jgi:hypothetical protein
LTDRTGSSGGAGREHAAKAAAAASGIRNLEYLEEGRKAGKMRMGDPVKKGRAGHSQAARNAALRLCRPIPPDLVKAFLDY